MSNEAEGKHNQEIEQVATSIATCRCIVQQAADLDAGRRCELLAALDSVLHVLNSPAAVSRENAAPLKSEQPPPGAGEEALALRTLGQLYQTYTSAPQSNTRVLTARFNGIITAINDVQKLIEGSRDLAPHRLHAAALLQQAGGFMADLYCLFMEFMQALSITLDEQHVPIDTEKVSSAQTQTQEGGGRGAAQIDLYEIRRHLDARRNELSSALNEAAVFVVFLENALRRELRERTEVVAQINNLLRLLHDSLHLLSDYESALAFLLPHAD